MRKRFKCLAARILPLALAAAISLAPRLDAQTTQPPNASDQSNDRAALKLAAQIRRALVRDKSLSVRAHNITIVVKNGVVTLRGAVDSAHEKQAVHQKVQRIAGSVPVTDLLTVKR